MCNLVPMLYSGKINKHILDPIERIQIINQINLSDYCVYLDNARISLEQYLAYVNNPKNLSY